MTIMVWMMEYQSGCLRLKPWPRPPILPPFPGKATKTRSLLRSSLKLRHMRLVVALEEHGQISAAAHMMNISQPAASRMIAEIEGILGVASAKGCRAAFG